MVVPFLAIRSRERGFSLIEVMLTVGLFALLAGAVTVSMRPGMEAATVRSEATALRSLLADARTASIIARTPVAVSIDPRLRLVTVSHGSVAGRRFPPDLAVATGTGDQPLAIWFYPDGTTSGGAFELALAGRRTQLSVNWLTGRVSETANVAGRR
jgi:general secretion pathway protein H